MLRQLGSLFSRLSLLPARVTSPKTCAFMHQMTSTQTGRFLPPIFVSIPPATNTNLSKDINILELWKSPQKLPGLAVPLEKKNPVTPTEILNPSEAIIEKHAARMIVIRRRMMKKHKLRKLRKRRKFEYRRIALKRKTLKERAFEMKLVAQIKEAESFDPKNYVENMIRKAKEEYVDLRRPWNFTNKKNPALFVDGKRIIPTHLKTK